LPVIVDGTRGEHRNPFLERILCGACNLGCELPAATSQGLGSAVAGGLGFEPRLAESESAPVCWWL